MAGKYEAPRKKNNLPLILILTVLVLAVVVTGVLLVRKFNTPDETIQDNQNTTESTTGGGEQLPSNPFDDPTEPPTDPVPPEPVTAVASATILSTGDILPHMGVTNSGQQSDGSYDYENIFRYVAPFVTEADYSVANLETTLCGLDNGYKYSGYPNFNTPDEIAVGAMDAGFDMLLTANNHCYDTGMAGLSRTVTTVREIGLDTLGTMASADEPKYTIIEVNGIRIGMMCYTYETSDRSPDRPSLNGMITSEESLGMINSFDYDQLEKFYGEIQTHMENMDNEGVDAVVLYIHWGEEYQLSPNKNQTQIAQELCNLGIDVIIGGHPHVIQPMELLTSTVDENHKTVCLYSMGNFVSNQRLGLIDASKTAHTEDGMLFSLTFTRYSDGTVALTGVDIIPCWVNRHNNDDGKREYNVLPLVDSERENWREMYGLTDYTFGCCEDSYERTMELVGEGLTIVNDYLAQKEADFLVEANN